MELQTKVHALERELDAANFKALYYSALVKVVEQELGIAIEKSLFPNNLIHTDEFSSYPYPA